MYASNKLNKLQYPTDLGNGKSGWLPHATVSLTAASEVREAPPIWGCTSYECEFFLVPPFPMSSDLSPLSAQHPKGKVEKPAFLPLQ